jgi:RHS repeat-associated protein
VGRIVKVDFYQGATLIGTATSAPFSFTWTSVAAGQYSLSAVATNDAGQTATSAAIAITVRSAVAQIYYIHVDHLNTPRLIADATGTTVWRWDQQEPFGVNVPDENPSGLGAFEFPVRFPGQYFDKETALHQNEFRDYWPDGGRYIESDPIGLRGGLNTYLYVEANPLQGTDPLGLAQFCCRDLDSFVLGTVLGHRHCYVVADDSTVYGLYPETVRGRTVGVPRTNDPRDRGGDCFDCPKLECGPDQNACLRNAHNGYPRGTYKAYPGPNSNTYAATLARQCCQGGVPSGASGAPGFNSSPPTR